MIAVAVDLLTWPLIRDAEARVLAARQAWETAKRRYLYAPHGLRKSRLMALQEASSAALKAEHELAELRQGDAP